MCLACVSVPCNWCSVVQQVCAVVLCCWILLSVVTEVSRAAHHSHFVTIRICVLLSILYCWFIGISLKTLPNTAHASLRSDSPSTMGVPSVREASGGASIRTVPHAVSPQVQPQQPQQQGQTNRYVLALHFDSLICLLILF